MVDSQKIAELYLSCTKCRRIPDWTSVKMSYNEQGHKVKKYEHTGVCPYCGGEEMEVIEVTSGHD